MPKKTKTGNRFYSVFMCVKEEVKKYISRSATILRMRKRLRENVLHYCRSGMLTPKRSLPGRGIPNTAARE